MGGGAARLPGHHGRSHATGSELQAADVWALGVLGGAIARKRFIEMRNNMLRIQTRFRAFKARTNYVDQAAGFGRLQATIKMKKLTTEFRNARARVIAIQAYALGKIARDNFKARSGALALIQAALKTVAAQSIVRKANEEAEAERVKQEAMKRGLDEAEAEKQKQEALAAAAALRKDSLPDGRAAEGGPEGADRKSVV